MKRINILVFSLLGVALFFSSCNKNSFDLDAYEKELLRKDSIEKVRVQGIINSQRANLKAFVDENMAGATNIDSLGIWFKIIENGDETSYNYEANSSGKIIAPIVTVNYKGKLLNGTIFDQTKDNEPAQFNLSQVIPAWQFAFIPKSLKLNGTTLYYTGLTNTGLKKGSKIQIVTTSAYAYDTTEIKDNSGKVLIPANSPLYFEIEVVDIK